MILLPRNPVGRTGMVGRGLLGKWGPNHAADPIVTRWKRDPAGNKVSSDGKPLLEFVAIKRRDTGEWAIPGVSVCHGKAHDMGRSNYRKSLLILYGKNGVVQGLACFVAFQRYPVTLTK